MMVIRPVEPGDLPGLLKLAAETGGGLTSLPVPEVVQHCSDLGFGVGEIFALCGPFSAEFNAAFYRQCRADVVVTKASGAEGGYQEKVQPCLDAGIPCIVITRPAPLVKGDELLESQADFATRLTRWLSAT